VAITAAAILAGSGLLLLRDRWPKRRPEALAVEPVVGQVVGMLGFTVALALGLTWRLVGTSYLWTLPGLATALPLLCWLLLPPPAMGRTAQQLWLLLLPGLLSTAVLWFTLLRIVRVMVGAQLPIAITLPVAVCLSAYEPLAQLATLRQRSLVLLAVLLTLLSALVIAVG
jgi:hypothetical protein